MCAFHERGLSIVNPRNLVLVALGMMESGTTTLTLDLLFCFVKNCKKLIPY
jgi:hypothetical protein